MSEMASKVYYKILSVQNADTTKTQFMWPMYAGFSPDLAISILDVYHDLVANKGYNLPDTNADIKKLTAKIRAVLGLPNSGAKALAPANVILAMKQSLSTSEPSLFNWAFPKKITPEPEPEPSPNPIVETTSNIKWILIAGLVGYVFLQTGVLKKLAPA